MDLMRYADDAPKNVMDFLFVELLALGPRAGLRRPSSSAWRRWRAWRTGRWRRSCRGSAGCCSSAARNIYNFRGVRRYKDKYDPVWQPRYIAAPHKWAIPILLADVGLMSSGGVAGLTRRGKRTEDKASERRRAA